MYHVLVIIEQGERNYSAYAPDLPGCIATGRTKEDTEENMRGALVMHLQGMLEDGEPMPPLNNITKYVEVSLPRSAQ